MSVPDDERLEEIAPGIVEAMEGFKGNVTALTNTIETHGITPETMRMSASVLRASAAEFERLAEGLESRGQ